MTNPYTDIRRYNVRGGLAYYDETSFTIGSLMMVMEELKKFKERQSKLREEQRQYLRW